MIRSPEIRVNPDVLKTLRESSGYTVEEIAKKIKSTTNKVQDGVGDSQKIINFQVFSIRKSPL
ncbi:MAG: hypothetical protein ACOYU4_05385 [Thermodesulfobacteriota bacterium]